MIRGPGFSNANCFFFLDNVTVHAVRTLLDRCRSANKGNSAFHPHGVD